MKHLYLSCFFVTLLVFLVAAAESQADWDFTHVAIDGSPLAIYEIYDVDVGDIDGDGLKDVFVTGRDFGEAQPIHQSAWYKNPGGDLLAGWQRFTVFPAYMRAGALIDIDRDGDLDIMGGNPAGGGYWYRNDGVFGSDWAQFDLGCCGPHIQYDFVDVDKDGTKDLVYRMYSNLMWAHEMDGTPYGPWHGISIFYCPGTENRSGGDVGDIDGDGDIDVLFGNAWFENPWPAVNPKETTDPWPMHYVDESWPKMMQAGAIKDLDGDGSAEIILAQGSIYGIYGIAWYSSSDPYGSWTQHMIDRTIQGVGSLRVADFNADGKLDIFIAEKRSSETKQLIIYEQVDLATNTWEKHVIDAFGSHHAKVEDLDNDGDLDIVGTTQYASDIPVEVDIWINEMGGAPDSTPPTASDGSPSGVLPGGRRGTVDVTLSLSTDENAMCKYSDQPDTPYGSMLYTFTTTDEVYHSALIPALENGRTYSYFVRCSDESGNENDHDFTISFGIARSRVDFPNIAVQFSEGSAGEMTAGGGCGLVAPELKRDSVALLPILLSSLLVCILSRKKKKRK